MLNSIQILRAIAALLVLFSHVIHKIIQKNFENISSFDIGASGVDLFFIISGFIMCFTCEGKNVTFTNFIKNRIIRIIPLYWILTTAALFIFLIKPELINSSGGNTSIIDSYFLLPSGEKFLIQNGWTLSYEFYFYFIFALFLIFNFNYFYKKIAVIITILLFVTLGLFYENKNPYILFATNEIILEFCLGILCYIFYKKFQINNLIAFFLITIGVTLLLIFHHNVQLNFRSLYYGLPMTLIFIGFINLENVLSKNKSITLNFLKKIGDSSYSLYLVHPFVISLNAIIFIQANIGSYMIFFITTVIISIIVSYYIFKLIELPTHKILKKIK